ncbi:hypothetical protein PAERUG_P48_London_17_VIM_2_01_13_03120 [Pseudomonas aeruginosa]|nr:hypothetical protein PAERUG_P48_London_17_VIM_2_01_13_03120 [Pseudomonas aeruginosa]
MGRRPLAPLHHPPCQRRVRGGAGDPGEHAASARHALPGARRRTGGSPRGDPGAPPAATPHLVAAGRRDLRAGPGVLVQRRQPAPAGIPRGLSAGRAEPRTVSLAGAAGGQRRAAAALGPGQPALGAAVARCLSGAAPALRPAGRRASAPAPVAGRLPGGRRRTGNRPAPRACRAGQRRALPASRAGALAGAAVAVSRRALDAFRQCGGRRGSGRRRRQAPGRPQRSAQARRAHRGTRQRTQPAAVPPGKPAQLVGAPGPGPL